MRCSLSLFLVMMFILSGCSKKSKPVPVEENNKNQILGYVTVAGRDAHLFTARADSTSFVRTTNNDTIIQISGVDGNRHIRLRLVNITANGTYSFQNADTTIYDVTRASYSESMLSDPALFYSTDGTNHDLLSFGTVEIFDVSDTHIQAKLNVMLGDTGSSSKVYLEEILIAGDFNK